LPQYLPWYGLDSENLPQLASQLSDELENKVSKKTLLVRRLSNSKPKPEKMTYEEFRDKITELLKSKRREAQATAEGPEQPLHQNNRTRHRSHPSI